METEQIQIEKTYSFEEICPDWAQILADNGGFMANQNVKYEADDGTKRSIMSCPSCIVGEAHG